MKNKLNRLLLNTLEVCFEKSLLNRASLPNYVIEVPNNPDHGHFATNLPLALASIQKRNPREIASILIENLQDKENLLAHAETAGPGFINFRIKAGEWYRLLHEMVRQGDDYGRNQSGEEERVLVEFVSANPTGPLHLGHGRGAALGDTLSRILQFCGYDVVKEFYINDAGVQVRMLGESIYSRYRQMENPDYPFPENGYHGTYVTELAESISGETDLTALTPEEGADLCSEKGKDLMLKEIKRDLSLFKVDFDHWYSESALFESKLLDKTLDDLKTKDLLFESDGALWIKTSEFGDDKDRVIRKSDGQFTYFASDIAYHLEKKRRGYTKAINLWGADHHGYVPRISAALSAQGIAEGWLSVMLIQLVKLWKEGHEIKMSKRAGSFVTLKELVDEVGVDAVRFVLLTKNHDSSLDFDIDLVKKRIVTILSIMFNMLMQGYAVFFRKARQENLVIPDGPKNFTDRLVLEEEMALIRAMAQFPALLEDICLSLEPHRLTYYLTELAGMFHRYFYQGTKVPEKRMVTADKTRSQARLFLAQAVKTVILNGLGLLGVSAPERM